MNDEQTASWLSARMYLYRALNLVYAGQPRREHVEELASEESRQTLALFDGGSFGDFLAGRLGDLLSDAGLDELGSEYTRLFLGPAASPVPPWSSSYRLPDEGTLFNGVVLSVRSYYRAQGYACAWNHKVADDHIGIMMDFMADLARRAWELWDGGDSAGCWKLVIFQGKFLRDCLLNWLPAYAAAMERRSRSEFFKAVAAFTVVACRADEELIGELDALAA